MSVSKGPGQQPSLSWRMASKFVIGVTGLLSKGFIYGFNRVEVVGLDKFLAILESRRDVQKRQRGLLTVSNHISVMDDPLMWGILPLRYLLDPPNIRFGLGAHDICYKNKLFSSIFILGQTLPTHRLNHSPLGGLFQPTMTQAIRLLSNQPAPTTPPSLAPFQPGLAGAAAAGAAAAGAAEPDQPDTTTYTTTGADAWPEPSADAANAKGWVHIFPEGSVHQEAERTPRYFRWGVARLVLEADPPPAVVPVFVEGTDTLMPENRTFPRFLPRVGRRLRVVLGDELDFDATFGDLRGRWEGLVRRAEAEEKRDVKEGGRGGGGKSSSRWWWSSSSAGSRAGQEGQCPGGSGPVDLRDGPEARAIRVEVASRMRNEVLKLRSRMGYPDSDPALGLAETWAKDHPRGGQNKYRSHVDGGMVSQD